MEYYNTGNYFLKMHKVMKTYGCKYDNTEGENRLKRWKKKHEIDEKLWSRLKRIYKVKQEVYKSNLNHKQSPLLFF